MFRCILGGIAYVQKSLKDLEDVQSTALCLRPGQGQFLEDWEDDLFPAMGLRPEGGRVWVVL